MKLVILDRDGVINEDSDDYIKSPQEWIPIPGSLEAIARLKAAGYHVAVATNQSGIARGYYDVDTLQAMHQKMAQLLSEQNTRIDYIAFCPHLSSEDCDCRKPKPGMLNRIANALNADLSKSIMIGDTLGDMGAAQAAGAAFSLVKTGKGIRTINSGHLPNNIPIYENLADFVDHYLKDQT